MSNPYLSDIDPADSEGVKWAKLQQAVKAIPSSGGGSAPAVTYTPTTPSNWPAGSPTTVQGALDTLGSGNGKPINRQIEFVNTTPAGTGSGFNDCAIAYNGYLYTAEGYVNTSTPLPTPGGMAKINPNDFTDVIYNTNLICDGGIVATGGWLYAVQSVNVAGGNVGSAVYKINPVDLTYTTLLTSGVLRGQGASLATDGANLYIGGLNGLGHSYIEKWSISTPALLASIDLYTLPGSPTPNHGVHSLLYDSVNNNLWGACGVNGLVAKLSPSLTGVAINLSGNMAGYTTSQTAVIVGGKIYFSVEDFNGNTNQYGLFSFPLTGTPTATGIVTPYEVDAVTYDGSNLLLCFKNVDFTGQYRNINLGPGLWGTMNPSNNTISTYAMGADGFFNSIWKFGNTYVAVLIGNGAELPPTGQTNLSRAIRIYNYNFLNPAVTSVDITRTGGMYRETQAGTIQYSATTPGQTITVPAFFQKVDVTISVNAILAIDTTSSASLPSGYTTDLYVNVWSTGGNTLTLDSTTIVSDKVSFTPTSGNEPLILHFIVSNNPLGNEPTQTAYLISTSTSGNLITNSSFTSTNNTLSNVAGLSYSIGSNATLKFKATLYTTSNVAAGVKSAIAFSGTGNIIYSGVTIASGIVTYGQTTTSGTAVAGVTAVTASQITLEGTLVVTNSGDLTVQFAQNASNASASTVLAGSTLEVENL